MNALALEPLHSPREIWYQITVGSSAPALVTAANWMAALGEAVRILDLPIPTQVTSQTRSDGAIEIHDAGAGVCYIVQTLGAPLRWLAR